jgi:hypothetical protein
VSLPETTCEPTGTFVNRLAHFCALTLSPGADTILGDGVRFLALRPVCFHGLVFVVLCAGFQFGVCGYLLDVQEIVTHGRHHGFLRLKAQTPAASADDQEVFLTSSLERVWRSSLTCCSWPYARDTVTDSHTHRHTHTLTHSPCTLPAWLEGRWGREDLYRSHAQKTTVFCILNSAYL